MSGIMNQLTKQFFETSKSLCTALALLDNSWIPKFVCEILADTVVTLAPYGGGDNFASEVIFLF